MSDELTSSRAPKRKPLWRRVLKWGVRMVIVLVVAGVAAYAIGNHWAAKSIRDEVARIRAAGEPVTFADLDAAAAKDDPAQDAGPYYGAALSLVSSVNWEEPPRHHEEGLNQFGPATAAASAEPQPRVEDDRLALEMLDRGSKLSGCNYDMELRYGAPAVMPRLNKWRALATAASMRTRAQALEGKGDEAVQSVISSLGILRVFDRQPVMIVYLVKVGCTALFCKDVRIILEHGNPSARSLEDLERALAPVEQSLNLRSVYQAERVYYLEIVRNIISGSRPLKPFDVNAPPLPETSTLPTNLPARIMVGQSLPVYGRYLEAAGKGWPGALDATKALASEPRSPLVPSFPRVTATTARCIAQLRSTLVALRIERYRQANGRLPDSLAELPGHERLPNDPFTVAAPTGAQIPLGQLANITVNPGPPMIRSENAQRTAWVFVDIAGRDLGGYVAEARRVVADQLQLPPGYTIVWSGQFEYLAAANRRLAIVIPITIVLIVLLLYISNRSWFRVGVVMLAVPFSLIGAFWFLWLLDYNMSLAVWVGIIALLGVDAETGQVMLLYLDTTFDRFKSEGRMRGPADLYWAIHEGAVKRIRPKTMTVATDMIGLLPLLWATGTGADVTRRLVAPLIGGITISFIMELLVYPVIFYLAKRWELRRQWALGPSSATPAASGIAAPDA